MSRCKFLLACAVFFAPPLVASAETRAVLVGVSAYEHLGEAQQLQGAGNDVAEVRALLIARGVRRDNIKSLAGPGKAAGRLTAAERAKLPTRQNIMDALAALKENSKTGDFAIVYLSGHGSFQSHVPGAGRDEGDGRDKVFLPYDVEISSDGSATVIKNGIVDYEIRAFQAAIRDKGVDLWFTLDSCYSGSGLRAAGQARFKFIDPELLGVRVPPSSSAKAVVNFGDLEPPETRAGPIRRGKAAFLYASQGDERAAELPLPLSVPRSKQTWRSVFTHAMAMSLARHPKLTYRQVIDYANDLMRELGGHEVQQTAGQDGNLVNDRVIGGGTADALLDQWPVHNDRLAAGVLHGIEKGAIVSLFSDPNAPNNQAKGYAEVKQATASESRISPIREYPCPFVNGNPRCRDGGSEIMDGARYARFVAPPRDYTLAVSAPRPAVAAPDGLVTLAKDVFGAIRSNGEQKDVRDRLRFDDDNPDFIWWVTYEGFRLLPPGVDPTSLQTGAGMKVDASEPREVVISRTVRLLLRAYRVERLRRLAAEPGGPRAGVALSIEARTNSNAKPPGCRIGMGAPVLAADNAERARACSVVRARITNSSGDPRYISVFTIDANWDIKRRCADDGDSAGTGALYAGNRSKDCQKPVWTFPGVKGEDNPNIPDVARFEVLVLSTPRLEGVGPPSFDSIDNLNNDAPRETRRGAVAALEFDDALTGGGFTRGARDVAPPSITIVGWELDASAAANLR